MSIADTTIRFESSTSRSLKGRNIGGRADVPAGTRPRAISLLTSHSSTVRTNSGSRSRRLSYVMRRLRVIMLKTNWMVSWWMYCPISSNHTRLACAARCVLLMTGSRSSS